MRPPEKCWCLCHNTERALQRVERDRDRLMHAFQHAQQALDYMGVDVVEDAVAAVFACDRCRPAHCPVLLRRLIWGPRIVKKDVVPYVDPTPARTDGGEGAE